MKITLDQFAGMMCIDITHVDADGNAETHEYSKQLDEKTKKREELKIMEDICQGQERWK